MDDLFRFLLLRPAVPVDPDNILVLNPTFVTTEASWDEVERKARAYVAKPEFVISAATLSHANIASLVTKMLRGTTKSASEIADFVASEAGKPASELVEGDDFQDDERRIANSLVAMKLLSDSHGGDAAGLAQLAKGYDAIRLATNGRETIALRTLSYKEIKKPLEPREDGTGGSRPEPTEPNTKPLREVRDAVASLRKLTAAAFTGPAQRSTRASSLDRAAPTNVEEERAGHGGGRGGERWVLSKEAAASIPATIRKTLESVGIDLTAQPFPLAMSALHATQVELEASIAAATIGLTSRMSKVGVAYSPVSSNEFVGPPSGPFPTAHGTVRPVGVGDLLVVKQHALRYEGGDLAHIENVLRSESLTRETRRLERTETSIMFESEQTKEETRDTQTTDRFSLKRETESTIESESSLAAGLAVDAKYGPFVEVKANAAYATSTSTSDSVKQASEFSQDIVSRSVSKLVDRVLERRSVTTVSEFEEKYTHGFDNSTGGNISGCYQWVDKLLQAQVYNYGRRLLFDIAIPEPATNYMLMQGMDNGQQPTLEKPIPFTLTALDLDEGNYTIWGKEYDATGLESPPPPIKTVVKAIDRTIAKAPYASSKSEVLAIDAGYQARYANIAYDYWQHTPARLAILIGNNWMEMINTPSLYVDMAGEVGSVAFAYHARNVENLAATMEIFCERTDQAFKAWQLKTHDAITQAYLAKVQTYEHALAQAEAEAMGTIAGQNPLFNRRIIAGELRRQCVALITGQQFDGFGALELSAEGYAQPAFDRAEQQMPYVRFFEQAFEWEHIVWSFYPYFWGWKPGWKNRMTLDDVDPEFGQFLRAGAARIVIPVRPGFEAAIVHFLESSQIWNGGPPPDITGSLYVPIVREIEEATGAPQGETPVGEPWNVRLPTTLVRLRPDDDLPEWHKVGEEWQPVS